MSFTQATSLLEDALQKSQCSDATGLCFPFAMDTANEFATKDNWNDVHAGPKVVHGKITTSLLKTPIDHAWVEHEGRAYDYQNNPRKPEGTPIADFVRAYNPKRMTAYSAEAAMINGVRAGNYGPWEPHEQHIPGVPHTHEKINE